MRTLLRRDRLFWAFAGLSVTLALSGCGDDDDSVSTNSPSGAPTETTEATSTSTASQLATLSEAPTSNVDTDELSDLQDLSKDLADATGRVTYQFESTASGEQFVGTTTIYYKEGNSRTDFSSDEGTYTIIATSTASYFCVADSGEGFCTAGEGGLSGVSTLPFVQSFSDDEQFQALIDGLSQVNAADSQTIAGKDAKCYRFTGDFGSGPGNGTMCFSDTGLTLLSHFDADNGDTYDMEASEVSEDVSGSDFEPPYPVTP
jgi:hypothetical protein